MTLSVFDIFKVGIGPSSSHTMGPDARRARVRSRLEARRTAARHTSQIAVRLYGSLALTGVGHGTDRAVLAGLEGAEPETVDPDSIEPTVAAHPRHRPHQTPRRARDRVRRADATAVHASRASAAPFQWHAFHRAGARTSACCARRITTPSAAASSFAAMRPRPARRACKQAAAVSVQLGRRAARRAGRTGWSCIELVLANERTWRPTRRFARGCCTSGRSCRRVSSAASVRRACCLAF